MKVGVKNRILNMQSCLTSTVRDGRAWSEYQATATIIHRGARYDATRLLRAPYRGLDERETSRPKRHLRVTSRVSPKPIDPPRFAQLRRDPRLKCRWASLRARAGNSRATVLTSRGGLGKLWDADDRES